MRKRAASPSGAAERPAEDTADPNLDLTVSGPPESPGERQAHDSDGAPEPLTVALRAYTEALETTSGSEGSKGHSDEGSHEPRTVLVFDTETTTDQAQRLMFGVYRYHRWSEGRLVCVEEMIFHADELPETDPDGYETLRRYVRTHARSTAADSTVDDSTPILYLITETEFRESLRTAATKDDGSGAGGSLIVGFNLPFDLSRLALDWSFTRSPKYASGFSLRLWPKYINQQGQQRESKYRPRLGIKHLGSTKALKGFIAPFTGHFLDLRTLCFALTNTSHSLASASKAFGVIGADDLDDMKRKVEHGRITLEYVSYCREDVRASAELYERAITEYHRHPISLQATQAYSPASIGKSYLDAMGIKPRSTCQPVFSREVLGKAMSAYYGGRTECRIRRMPVPVVYCDFLSMYTTVNALMGLWAHVTARRIDVQDANEQIRAVVQRIGVEDCLDPATWLELPALVQIKPAGDVLPLRAQYDGTNWNIGSNPLWADEPLWYALPDVIASKLITGEAPQIIRALRLVPGGRQRGLKPVKLRGEIEVDPRREDFFRAVIERRKALPASEEILDESLKVTSNSTSYGIYAEMRRRELPGKRREQVTVHGKDEAFEVETATPETPGPYCFPPMAACITAAARLMLATLETLVVKAGGTWAFCDTDSMAIVATEDEGPVECPGGRHRKEDGSAAVRALSFEQVDEIVRRFEALNPYDRTIVPGSVLEIEKENYEPDASKPGKVDRDRPRQLYCYAISAKRYALYNLDSQGQPILRSIFDEPDTEDSEPSDDEDPDTLGELRKHSEHGLGHLLNPGNPEDDSRKWIGELWQHIIRTDGHGQEASEPPWLDHPAVTRSAVTTWELQRRFETYNLRRSKIEQVRPFNFHLIATVARFGHPTGSDPQRFALIAPFEKDPKRWHKLGWTNFYEPGSRYKIATQNRKLHPDDQAEDLALKRARGIVIVKTFRDVLTEYRLHPEAKSLGPDDKPCDQTTVGLLRRRPAKIASVARDGEIVSAITYIGKESNKLMEIASGLVTDLDDALNEYPDPEQSPLWELARAVIDREPVQQVAAKADVSSSTVKNARAGKLTGKTARTAEARAKLITWAVERARAELRPRGAKVYGVTPEALLATYLDAVEQEPSASEPERLCACGCGQPIPATKRRGQPRKYIDETHRKRAQRARTVASDPPTETSAG